MPGIQFAYALNAWRPTYDTFVRPEQHARALKTVSVSGFRAVELNCGAGRWEPLGNLEDILVRVTLAIEPREIEPAPHDEAVERHRQQR